MNITRSCFTANDTVILFVYGQVFFILALSIILRSFSQSRLEMARTLPLLAAFALTQALVKWVTVFIPIQALYTSDRLLLTMRAAQLLLLVTSFTSLLAFGLKMMLPRLWHPQTVRRVSLSIYLFWIGAILAIWLLNLAPPNDIILTADVASRYLLALPGGLLAAVGLCRQAQAAIGSMKVTTVNHFLRAAGIALAIYALLDGLIVPSAPFFPANFLNQEAVHDLLGVPPELFLALVGLVLTYSISKALQVFQIETNHWVEEMERAQTLAADRERIGRELHDGTIQSIYASGLILEDVRQALDSEPERARAQLDRAIASLNRAIQDIRSYIFDLRHEEEVEDIGASIARLIKDFRINTLIEVDLCIEGKERHMIGSDRAQDLYQIAREALSNVARHARAQHVEVLLHYGERHLILRIADDGVGFPTSSPDGSGRGLKNMRERAQLLEGALVVEGTPDEGVTVALTVPYKD